MENALNTRMEAKVYSFGGILIISLFFTAIVTLILMYQINSATTMVSKNWLPSVIIAEELNTATSDFRVAEANHLNSQGAVSKQQYEQTLENISARIDEMFEDYSANLVTNKIDAALLAEARLLWSKYLIVSAVMIEYSKQNSSSKAMSIMRSDSRVLFDEVSAVFLELVHFNKDGVDKASKDGNYIFITALLLIFLFIFLALVIFAKVKNLMVTIDETQEKLKHSHEEALLLSKAKSNFLANMSHEIRTPMNAICGMIDIILRDSKEPEITNYAHSIKRACDSLLAIINDVLDISKIESGKLDIIESEYKLSNVLNDVLTIINNRLEVKPLMLVTNFQHDLPDKLIGDDVRIKQIMVNILNNAVKFTHKGHITFNVGGDYRDGVLQLRFSVKDTGIGISEEDKDKLFVEFERVNTTKNRNIEGTGLGLAISKRLSEMMHGRIEVESEVGEGTEFIVTVRQKYEDYTPIAHVDTPKSVLVFESRDLYRKSIESACKQLSLKSVVSCSLQSELNEALAEQEFDYIFTSSMYQYKVQKMLSVMELEAKIVLLADSSEMKLKQEYTTILLPANAMSIANVLNGKASQNERGDNYIHFKAPTCKILIVDDNIVNLNVARGLMKPYEFEIDTAVNGEEAVAVIQQKRYDLVFMDHMMPIMDGIDATIAIRQLEDEYYKTVPIIALTANAIMGAKEMFIKEGMNDFLAKPIKLNMLNDALLKWLPKDLIIREEDDNAMPKKEEKILQIEIPNVDTKLGLSRIGGDFDTYINILNVYYKDGVKRAASILDFFNGKKLADYKIEVHALKSASASIGALDISHEAKSLEEAATRDDWDYINQSTIPFLEHFNALLENIRHNTMEFDKEDDYSGMEMGDLTFYIEKLKELEEALDNADINKCDEILESLTNYNWEKDNLEQIAKIKNFISSYEYDEAFEYIVEILAKK